MSYDEHGAHRLSKPVLDTALDRSILFGSALRNSLRNLLKWGYAMKAIMVMFDSLNRRMLPAYGCDWIHAPAFERLAENSVTFTNSFIGSMACIPARRELHTGRYNFLHRSWGPLEPYDDSVPELLRDSGIYSHLVTDHYHYWEDGGATYHPRYTSCEFSRGQEGDRWKAEVRPLPPPESLNRRGRGAITNLDDPKYLGADRFDWVNRRHMPSDSHTPQATTFALAEEFLETNAEADDWFLHIETFDPHEPFFSHPEYREMYRDEYSGVHWDWPPYTRVTETEEAVAHIRAQYAALVSKCDQYLGRILDSMDRHDLWKDTMLIVNTDHGYLLGEHGWWAKCVMPFYHEIANTPLFIWDPRFAKRGERRHTLVQTIDLPATLLEFFDQKKPTGMQGVTLSGVIESDRPVRDAALYGIFAGHVNCTDGRFVYMRAPIHENNEPLYEYTLMPTQHGRNRAFVATDRLARMEVSEPFTFTKGCRLMKIPGRTQFDAHPFGTRLYDLETDPGQEHPVLDPVAEKRMTRLMISLMRDNDAPVEQYKRLGLETPAEGHNN
jgi:arylsulfatase A-like enzyme